MGITHSGSAATATTLLTAANRTADTNVTFNAGNARGVMLVLRVTSNPGGAETLNIELRQPAGNLQLAITTGLVTAANGTFGLLVYPGATETIAVTDLQVQGVPIQRSCEVIVRHSAAGTWNYSLDAYFIV